MSTKCDLSIVVPLYNEESNVARCVAGLRHALDPAGLDYELVLVNNGSRDGTKKEIDRLCKKSERIRQVNVPVNMGYGNGILHGFRASKGAVVGWAVGDCQTDYKCLPGMRKMLVSGRTDVVVAARLKERESMKRVLLSKGYNALMHLVFGLKISDINGNPKLLRRSALEIIQLKSKDWFIDTEILLKARKNGLGIATYPVRSVQRQHGSSNVRLTAVFEFVLNLLKYGAGLYN